MKFHQWMVVYFVALIHFMAFTQRMDVVPFLIELRDVYHVGYAEVGGLVSAFLLGYAFFQIPAGTLADRYSPKRIIFIGIFIMLITSCLFALTHSLVFAIVLRFVMGASSALLFSPAIKLLSAYTPRKKRGLSIGIMQGGAGAGMLLTLTIFPILSTYISFRTLFFIASSTLVIILIMFWFLPKDNKQNNIVSEDNNRQSSNRQTIFQLIKKRVIIKLIGISFFGMFGLYGFLVWLPTYLETILGFSKQQAGMIMAISMISQIVMGPVSGKVSDWMGERKTTLIIGSFIMVVSSLWLLVFRDFGIYIVAFLVGTGISWSMAPVLTLASEIVRDNEGSVISLINTIGQIASAISGYIYGLLFELSGHFQWIWLSCLIAFIIRIFISLGKLEDTPDNQINHESSSRTL